MADKKTSTPTSYTQGPFGTSIPIFTEEYTNQLKSVTQPKNKWYDVVGNILGGVGSILGNVNSSNSQQQYKQPEKQNTNSTYWIIGIGSVVVIIMIMLISKAK